MQSYNPAYDSNSLRDQAKRIYRMPSVNVFVDLPPEDLKKNEMPGQILKNALQFGRLQQMVVYQDQGPASGMLEWQRLGFDVSLAARQDISMDILDRAIVTGTMPNTIVMVTDSCERIEILRRLKRWVSMVVLIAPKDVKETLKRSANMYVPLDQVYEPAEGSASQDDIYREIITFIATTNIPFVGASYLTRTALPQQLRTCSEAEARQALSSAEIEGLVVIYDHVGDDGVSVKAVKLNNSNEYVQRVLDEEVESDFYPDDEPQKSTNS